MDLLTDAPSTPPADSSPAPISGQAVLDALSDTERQSWEQTGELPVKDAPADSSPAVPDAQAASTEAPAPPASEAGTPKTKGAESRKAELHAEIQTLLQQRAQLREELARQSPPPKPDVRASSPAPVSDAPLLKDFTARIGQDFETYEDANQAFLDARDDYRSTVQQRAAAQERYRQEVDTAVRTFAERRDAAIKADPQWSEKVAPSLLHLKPHFLEPDVPRRPDHDLAEGILLSEHAPKVMEYLTAHPETLKTLLQSPAYAIYRELGRIEAALTSPVPPPAETSPVPKPLSSAPPPPVVLGTKPSVTDQDWEAAVKRGDFSAYERAMNATGA